MTARNRCFKDNVLISISVYVNNRRSVKKYHFNIKYENTLLGNMLLVVKMRKDGFGGCRYSVILDVKQEKIFPNISFSAIYILVVT